MVRIGWRWSRHLIGVVAIKTDVACASRHGICIVHVVGVGSGRVQEEEAEYEEAVLGVILLEWGARCFVVDLFEPVVWLCCLVGIWLAGCCCVRFWGDLCYVALEVEFEVLLACFVCCTVGRCWGGACWWSVLSAWRLTLAETACRLIRSWWRVVVV